MNAAIWVTCKLALVTTLVLFVIGTPLAWWLAQGRGRYLRTLAEAVVALPLILPPTVLGFYLLLLLAPGGAIGQFSQSGLAFSFIGLVIGSVIYSLPFVVQPLAASFAQLDTRLLQLGRSQGLNTGQLLRHIVLPATSHAFVMAGALGFAHTVGEFGVVLMIGGSISGETKVVSIAIYEQVEALNYEAAHMMSGILIVMAVVMVALIASVSRISQR